MADEDVGPRDGIPDSEDGIETPEEHGRSLRRSALLTSAVGVAHALLFILSMYLLAQAPGANAPDAEVIDYYASGEDRGVLIAGLYIMPFAGIAFLWFIVALRMWTAGTVKRENVIFSNLQLVSGIVYLALFLAAAAAMSVMAASVQFDDGPVDPEIARLFPQYGGTLIIVFAVRMAAVFVFTTSNICRTAGILPRWFVYLGFVVGLFMLLSASLSPVLVMVFPVWLLVLSVLLMNRARQIPKEMKLPARAGMGMTNPFGIYPEDRARIPRPPD